MLKTLKGKKAYLMALAGMILSVIYGLDATMNDNPLTENVIETAWIAGPIYKMLAGIVGGGGVMAWRAAYAKGR